MYTPQHLVQPISDNSYPGTARCPFCRRQALPGGCRRPEEEPVPPTIDNWARGAVPCKHVSRLLDTPPSPSPRSSRDEEEAPHAEDEEEEEESSNSKNSAATMRKIDTHAAGGERDKGAVQRGGPSAAAVGGGRRAHRAIDNHNGNGGDGGDGRDHGDGRAWGERNGDEGEEEIMELLTTLSDGDPHGAEVLAGAGGIGDAIGRGRRHEERKFLEVGPNTLVGVRYMRVVQRLSVHVCRDPTASES